MPATAASGSASARGNTHRSSSVKMSPKMAEFTMWSIKPTSSGPPLNPCVIAHERLNVAAMA